MAISSKIISSKIISSKIISSKIISSKIISSKIISSKIEGIKASIKKRLELERDRSLDNYYLHYATLGHFYAENKEYINALAYLHRSTKLTQSPAEKRYLESKIDKSLQFLCKLEMSKGVLKFIA